MPLSTDGGFPFHQTYLTFFQCSSAEIAGYRDALNAIRLGFDQIGFTQRDILRLHEMMMSIAGYEYGGQYKTDDNMILEVDADGNRRVRSRPASAGWDTNENSCFQSGDL